MSARLVVLASGAGSTLQALLDASVDPEWGGRVVAVGSDRADSGALPRAQAADVPTFIVPPADFPDRPSWDAGLADAVAAHRPELVIGAGFMRILGAAFLGRFPDLVLNTHPALLPAFPGAHAVRDTLAYGAKVSGVTVHIVDAGVDTGPIVAQRAVPVEPGDDEKSLLARIQGVERHLLVDTVGLLARRGFTVDGRKVTL